MEKGCLNKNDDEIDNGGTSEVSKALDSTFVAEADDVDYEPPADLDVTMSSEHLSLSPTAIGSGIVEDVDPKVENSLNVTSSRSQEDLNYLKVDSCIDNDPDSLNGLTERCISLDSLDDDQDAINKDSPTSDDCTATTELNIRNYTQDLIVKDSINGNTTIVITDTVISPDSITTDNVITGDNRNKRQPRGSAPGRLGGGTCQE